MAENKETGLNIEVNAVANEKSAEEAVKKLADGVDKASKKGRIEVPVNINTLIDKKDTESKLSKAQLDVVKSINKMSKKGFSASAKDIDTLNSKMTEFGHQMDQAGKGRQNKIFREIRKQVDELNKSYKALQIDMKSTRVHDTKARRNNTSKRRQDKYNPDFGPVSEESIQASTKQHKQRQLKGLKQITDKLDLKKDSGIDPGRTNPYEMKQSEISSYAVPSAREAAKTERASRKLAKETERNYKVGSQEDLEAQATARNLIKGHNKNNFTPAEKAKGLSEDLRKTIPTLLDQIGTEQNEKDVDKLQTKLLDTISAIRKLSLEAGQSIVKSVISDFNIAIGKYFNVKGNIGGTDGTDKTAETKTSKIEAALKNILKTIEDESDAIQKELIEQAKSNEKVAKGNNKKKTDKTDKNNLANKIIDEMKTANSHNEAKINKLTSTTAKTNTEVRNSAKTTQDTTKAVDRNTTYDKIENVAERIADSKQERTNTDNKNINKDTAKAVKQDVATGFNTDANSQSVISLLQKILQNTTAILSALKPQKTDKLGLPESKGDGQKSVKEVWESIKNATNLTNDQKHQMLADASNAGKQTHRTPRYEAQLGLPGGPTNNEPPRQPNNSEPSDDFRSNKVQKSNIYGSPIKQTIWDKLEDAINRATGATKEYNDVISANADEQDRMAAERIKTYGLNNGRNPNDTGDIAGMRRILQLYRTNKASIEQNPELMQKIQLTEGREVDTTKVTKEFNDILSGKQMRNAQMGGSIPRQILGSMTGFIGMPSIEKSRAQADGLNQIMGNINKALNSVLSSIQMKETELSGMEQSGQAKFDDKGFLKPGSSSAAFKTLADLEEYKLVLDSILADMNTVDSVVGQTGGKFSKLVKRLSFTSPVLRENNDILRNINAGLDKGGKALKFQTRMAEILNYTFQLISRSIGQWFKKILSMLNPFNIMRNLAGQIKNLFSDFGSYDVKWQRTMNVIKINFQRVIKPMMEWIAQKLVNIIGFFDIVSQRIQSAFGKIPISLFDQAGAQSEQIRRNLEEAANVSLGFDELHDIGTDQSGANDLTGEIYKPQLSQDWIDMATKLGDTLGAFFKGDLGFGEVCKVILELLGKLLGTIGKMIWDWFKTTALGKWITEHWKGLLATLLALFLGWKLLKIFGPTLLGVIGKGFKNLGGLIWTGLKGIGNKFLDVLCGTQFGSDMVRGFKAMFNSGGMIGTFKAGGASLGAIFAQALTAVAGVAIATGSIAKGFDMIADDTSYNIGLMENGGDEKDKKSGAGGAAVSILGGAAGGALTGLAIGGPIGAAIGAGIGAIAGVISSVLAPAFEEAEVAARNMNNEMQKIEYYEGAVQGASTKVTEFTELENLMNQAVEEQTKRVYEQGEQLGISRTRLDELVNSVKDGTFNTDLLSASEQGLSSSLIQLSDLQNKNNEATKQLTEAKKKLQKAEMDLAIAQDIEAGNFELAAARIEVAKASELYTTEEATKKMVQIAKEGSAEQAASILQNLSPDLQKKFQEEYSTTERGLNELTELYFGYSKSEREYFLQNLTGEVQREMQSRVDAIRQAVENAPWWQRLLDIGNDGKIFGQSYIDVPGYATGTNYVPSDGLAYLHKGEAVIPAKYNEGVGMQGKAYREQAVVNSQLINAVARLEQTMAQGINVRGEFRQRGSDLVATVEKNKNRQSNNVLNNRVYAR